MKERYTPPDRSSWKGRESSNQLYLHEKVIFKDLSDDSRLPDAETKLGILGYACDEGVSRNQGRPGASQGPRAIREVLGGMPNHLPARSQLCDFGNIPCEDRNMEAAQEALAECISNLLNENIFCAVLGGGHDMSYGHYQGIRKHIGAETRLGIINFDAHFDLRSNKNGNNSGTPFYQIGVESKEAGLSFSYLCLGIRRDANDKALYDTTSVLGVNYLEMERFRIGELDLVNRELEYFIKDVDALYVTVDMDGFSSAYAPGVSAPSPMGFAPDIVLECLKTIIHSKKLIALDIAETNPEFDRDQQTAKLAASLLHFVFHRLALL